MRAVFQHADFALDRPLNGQELITLKERCDMPYWVSPQLVTLYHSRDAFRVRLQGGIQDWLKRIGESRGNQETKN